jgi:hypothetical protein
MPQEGHESGKRAFQSNVRPLDSLVIVFIMPQSMHDFVHGGLFHLQPSSWLMKADLPISIKEKLFDFVSQRFSLMGAPLHRRTGGAAAPPYQFVPRESYFIFVRM